MRQSIRLLLFVAVAVLFAGGWTCGARTGPRFPEPRDVERLAFDRPSPGRGPDVWIMELGREPSRLTTRARETYPAFNPGGDKVAFSSDRDVPSAVFAIGVDGRDEARLFSGARTNQSINHLRWAPDGRMAFAFDDGVWTFSSGSTRRITPDGVHASWPSFGPNGIYFSRVTGTGTRQIWFINSTTGALSRFLNTPDGADQPAWLADGSAIFYVFEGNIERINRDGSGRVVITRGSQPAPSPNNRRLAFVRDGAIWTAAIDGSSEAAATTGTQDAHPVWSVIVRQ